LGFFYVYTVKITLSCKNYITFHGHGCGESYFCCNGLSLTGLFQALYGIHAAVTEFGTALAIY
jgi:hypothetical protein